MAVLSWKHVNMLRGGKDPLAVDVMSSTLALGLFSGLFSYFSQEKMKV